MRTAGHLMALLILAVVVAGLAWGLPLPSVPSAEEASHLPLVESLWHDHDLRFESRDLARGLERWGGRPRGLALTYAAGATYYAGPLAYPLAALPFYALAGPRGMLLFNALLVWLAAAMLAAGVPVRSAAGGDARKVPAASWWLGGVLATALLAYLFQARPELFVAVCLLAAVWLWRRFRRVTVGGLPVAWVLAGALAAAVVAQERWLALFLAVIAADLLTSRAWRPLAAFLLTALLVILALLGVAGRLGPPTGSDRLEARFFDRFPGPPHPAGTQPEDRMAAESQWSTVWQRALTTNAAAAPGELDLPGAILPRPMTWKQEGLWGLGRMPRNALALALGRHSGLLPYFPFALLALVAALYTLLPPAFGGGRPPDDGFQLWLLSALVAALALLAWLGPEIDTVPVAAGGDRRLALLSPLFLLLAGRRSRWLAALGWLAAGLWTLPAVLGALPASGLQGEERATEVAAGAPVAAPPARWLPLELHLAAASRLPGYAARWWPGGALWLVPRASFFVEEGHPNGVWVRGDSRSELILVAREPHLDLPVRLHALGEVTARFEGGGETLRVRFDSLAKRQGTDVRLSMRPVARLPSPFTPQAGERVYYYRLVLTVEGGAIATLHDPTNADRRFLGLFLDLTGEGP